MKKYVTVKTSFEGFHRFPGAPEEVSYLKELHRHIFNVSAKIEVFHDDRELEFIMVKHRLNQFLAGLPIAKKEANTAMSCEMVATQVANLLVDLYGDHRDLEISVDEDGENGSIVEREGNK